MSGTLSRSAFVRHLAAKIETIGYEAVPGDPSPAVELFWKGWKRDFVLTLGIELSGRYPGRFTASFYLSKSFAWSLSFADFPDRAYQRIAHFLPASARRELLPREYSRRGVLDGWWHGLTSESIELFVQAIATAEPRFLSQPDLVGELRASEVVRFRQMLIAQTIEEFRGLRQRPAGLQHQPEPKAAGGNVLPEAWLWASELALCELDPVKMNPAYVRNLALDAWRWATLILV